MAASRKRTRTRYAGVYARECTNRQGRPDTSFDVCYWVNGKQVWKATGMQSQGQTAMAASRLRALILDDIASGGDGTAPLVKAGLAKPTPTTKPDTADASPMTFGDAWRTWRSRWGVNLSRKGADEDMRFKHYLEPALAHAPLDAITTMGLEHFKASLLARGLAASTVLKILGDVRRVYHKMAAWGLYAGKLPTTGLVMPKVDNARTRFLSRDEAAKLLDALEKRSPTWYAIAWLSLHTGMRKGEILALRAGDVDIVGQQILVRDAKTGSRSLPMTDSVASFLVSRLPADKGALVFVNANGAPIDSTADHTFRRIVAAIGLNDGVTDARHRVVFHSLRHTFCSWLAMSGVPLHTIAQLAGHSTTQMTARYSHLAPDQGRAAAAKIAGILSTHK